MNKILKEDDRLPDVWTVEIFLHKGGSKKFDIVHHMFLKDHYEIRTSKNCYHLFRHDSYSELAFDERYSLMLELKKEREEKNANTKAA